MYGYVSYQQDTFEDVFVLLVRVFLRLSHTAALPEGTCRNPQLEQMVKR